MAERTTFSGSSTPRWIPHRRKRVRIVEVQPRDAPVTVEKSDPLKDFGSGSPLIVTFVEQDGEQQVVLQTLSQERRGPSFRVERVRSIAYHVLLDDDAHDAVLDGFIPMSDPLEAEEPVQLPAESSSFRLLAATISGQPDVVNSQRMDADDPTTPTDEQRERQSVSFYELDGRS